MEKFGKYKVIVCGSREFNDVEFIFGKLDILLKNLDRTMIEIVSGCARGPDNIAIKYAEERGYKVWRFPPDWKHFGNAAGIVRNKMMAEFSTHCIAFWDGKSVGTKHMIQEAEKNGLLVRIINV